MKNVILPFLLILSLTACSGGRQVDAKKESETEIRTQGPSQTTTAADESETAEEQSDFQNRVNVYYYNNLESAYVNDRFEEIAQDTQLLTYGMEEEREKLHEKSLQEVTYCTTFPWNEVNLLGNLFYDCDQKQRPVREVFYNVEGDMKADISYKYMEDVLIPFITEYEMESSGQRDKLYSERGISSSLEDIVNIPQRFWLYREQAECDETGRWVRYHGSLHSGDRAVCLYDEAGKLREISEESEEFERDFDNPHSGEITFAYKEDGRLDTMKYSFVTARRSSYDSSGSAYYDEQERLFYRSYYVSHGTHFRFYLYKDEFRPWACMEVCSQAYSSLEDDSDIGYGNEFFFYLFHK